MNTLLFFKPLFSRLRIAAILSSMVLVSACALQSAGSDAWSEDYAAVLAQAKAEGKQVLLNFTGSDWCPPCMAMERNVLNEDAFLEGVADRVLLVTLDFPRRKAQEEAIKERNQNLAQQYGVRGFPTFVLLDAEGKEMRRTVGAMQGGPEAFLNWVNNG